MKKLIIIMLLAGMFFGVIGGAMNSWAKDVNQSVEDYETYEYTVRSGDTLNGIVYREYSEHSGYDVREVVWEIRNVYNDELDAMLSVGQTINLPKELN
jgi:nucleoid-associated protein YgaU